MKNRRIVIVSFLLAAVLCLGVGYAFTSDTLKAGGTIAVNQDALSEALDGDVYFVANTTNEKTATGGANLSGVSVAIAADDTDANDKFTVTITDAVFTAENQSVTVYVDVINENATTDVNVTVGTMNDVNSNLTAFAISMTPATQTVTANSGKATYAITIAMNKLPAAAISNGEFSFELNVTPVTPVTP